MKKLSLTINSFICIYLAFNYKYELLEELDFFSNRVQEKTKDYITRVITYENEYITDYR